MRIFYSEIHQEKIKQNCLVSSRIKKRKILGVFIPKVVLFSINLELAK